MILGIIDFNNDLKSNTKIVDSMLNTVCTSCEFLSSEAFLASNNCVRKMVAGEEYTIIFDGEIYNVPELAQELRGKRHAFFVGSESELVLNLYIEYGEKCLQKINGVFAFAIYKAREKSLFLARDRIGAKPLYYKRLSKGIVFASSLKTLFKHPKCSPVIDSSGLNQIFLLGPAKPIGKTCYKDIFEIKNAEYVVLDKSGFSKKIYWQLKSKTNLQSTTSAVDYLKNLVIDATNRQISTDKKIGSFLSGGLDSSILSAIASEKLSNKNKTLFTLNVDYEDNDKNFIANDFQPESDNEYIKIMVSSIGSKHSTTVIKTDDILANLSKAALAREFVGMADIDTSLLLASTVAKKTTSVMLSGECADELLGGYPWYYKPEFENVNTFPWSRAIDMRRGVVKVGVLKGDANEYIDSYYSATIGKAEILDTDTKDDARVRQLFMLNFEWFMQTLIARADRMASAAGISIRCPFADYRIIEYAYNLPWKTKFMTGREKGVLRWAFKDSLPSVVMNRKKSPFPKSFDPKLLAGVKKLALVALNNKNGIVGELIDKQFVLDLIDKGELQTPWYGQLMRLPQLLGFIIQLDVILNEYNVKIEK